MSTPLRDGRVREGRCVGRGVLDHALNHGERLAKHDRKGSELVTHGIGIDLAEKGADRRFGHIR